MVGPGSTLGILRLAVGDSFSHPCSAANRKEEFGRRSLVWSVVGT